MNFYQFEPILVFIVFAWVFYLHGAFVSEKLLLKQKGVDRLFINLSIGFCLVVFVLFFIALFHLLYQSFVIAFFLIIPVYYLIEKSIHKKFNFDLSSFAQGLVNHAWLIFAFLYLLLPDSYNLFFPETSSDAMRYHLPYARFYVENHGLAVNEFLRYPVFTHNFDMAFALGYLFLGDYQGEVLARMFSLFAFMLLVLGVYSFALRSFNKATAVIAVIILIKAKIFRTLMISGYIDIGLSLFLFSSIYFLYLWQKENKNIWLYLSAFALGIVLGTKYLGLLWLFPLAIWVFFTFKNWKNTYQFFLIAIFIGSPWYIRNIIIAGNPLHPFLQDIFGYWLWTPADVIGQKKDLLLIRGVDRSLVNFFKLPFLLEMHQYFSRFHLGWFMTLGIPFLVFAFKMERFFKYLAVFAFFNLVFWFFTSQTDRYLMPTLTFLSIYSAYPFGKILSVKLVPTRIKKYTTIISIIFLTIYSTYYLIRSYKKFNKYHPFPQSIAGWKNANHRQNKYYQFANVLNERSAKRVYNISEGMFGNSFNGEVLGDWFGVANKSMIYKDCHTSYDVKQVLRKFNTHYLLVSKEKAWFNKINKILKEKPNFKIVKENNLGILYFLN